MNYWQAVCQSLVAVLKITIRNNSGIKHFVVEGKLAGACVAELERCWQSEGLRESATDVCVDLTSVTFVDAAAKDLLKRMHEGGIKFVAHSLLPKSLVEEIENTH